MMNALPKKFILPKGPTNFIPKGFSHCGVYAIHGILQVHEPSQAMVHPKKLHISKFSEKTGFTTQWNLINLLRKFGFKGKIFSARKIKGEDKLNLLKQVLLKGYPVIIRTDLNEPGISKFSGKLIGHWISIWGYDENKQTFYVHDSRHFHDLEDLPIGNRILSYKKLLQDWEGKFMPIWWKYIYITISK